LRLCRDLAVRVALLLRVVSEYLAGLTKSNLEPFTDLFLGRHPWSSDSLRENELSVA
jgi:hypothetical protein